MALTIRNITSEELVETVHTYCELLADSVNNGASVGFLPPIDAIEMLSYWDDVRTAIYEGPRVMLVAESNERVVGCVQIGLETRANGSHRAEVMKLLVHSTARRQGIGTALMQAVEQVAKQCERNLLVLDTRKGDASWTLYQKLGYVVAGEIPGYARSANGELHTTVFFYKVF